MSLRVLKFGGTSVGSASRVARAAELIAQEATLGPVAVVVSAMGKTTDRLLAAAEAAARGDDEGARQHAETVRRISHQGVGLDDDDPVHRVIDTLCEDLGRLLYGVSLLREHSPASLDLILSFGERLSATGVAAHLRAAGHPARMVDARDFVATNDRFGDAVVDLTLTGERIADLAPGWTDAIPVVTGFLGRAPDGRTTTLGRNGSDYTATLLARALGASEVQIWTDVPGVYTADPALVDEAWPLTAMTYGEALELATFGARMFHPRTMIPLIESGIPMRIRSTLEPDAPGTRIDPFGSDDRDRATSVTSLEAQALLDLQVRRLGHTVRLAERVQAGLAAADVPVWMMTQSAMGQAIGVVVPHADADRALSLLFDTFAEEIARGDVHAPTVTMPVTLLTLVAEAMGRTPSVAGRLFGALGGIGVNVLAIGQSASARSISCVVHGEDTAQAVRAVHAGFNLAHRRITVLLAGAGVVGSELLSQIAAQQHTLRERSGLHPVVMGVVTRTRRAIDPDGVDPSAWAEALEAGEPVAPGEPVLTPAVLDQLARQPSPVLVDCTAAEGMEAVYAEAFERGIHVVAANKKPLTIPTADRDALLATARRHHRGYRYETTVGASLPVIETLQDLVQTGDRIRLIEGSFSGTLGYLSLALGRGVPLDEAVRAAREAGFTEPHPRDDLSGLDAARKALILAREMGLSLDLEDVALEPLVPAALLAEDDVDAFLAALKEHAPTMAARIEDAAARGKVVRYLATIDPSAGARDEPVLRVGPTEVDADHPAARLRGSEAFIAFHTERYATWPLLVQGAGAGGAVTAAGVLADVLRLVATLRSG